MKGKVLGFIITFFSVTVILLLTFYILVALRYREGFSYGTKINGILCTGKTVGEVNLELIKNSASTPFTVSPAYGGQEIFLPEDIDLSVDYTDALQYIISNQKPFLWFLNIKSGGYDGILEPVISFDENKLWMIAEGFDFVNECSFQRPQISEIRYAPEKGYFFVEDVTKLVSIETVYGILEDAVYSGNFEIEIPDSIFCNRELTPSQQKTYSVWEEASSYLETRITYDMGAEIIPLDNVVLSSFYTYDPTENDFKRNEDGSFLVNEANVRGYADKICSLYTTYESPRKYVTFSGEEKIIKNVYYGTEIDKEAEENYLLDAIVTLKTEKHVPAYKRKGNVLGLNDIGKDFIEVDLTNQVLYLILDNEIAYTTDIVSGKPKTGATPEMITSIEKMKEDTVLKGEGYSSRVDYWIQIHKAIGIHDATWQKSFGGDWYIKHGSHGCVNVSLQAAEDIYGMVTVGMPVIVYK